MSSFTRNEIKRSFIKLLETKKYSNITVRDIVDDCRINRGTFYYHFQDIPSLLEEIAHDVIDELIAQNPDIHDSLECFDAIVSLLKDNKRRIMHIYHSLNRETFEKEAIRLCRHFITLYISDYLPSDKYDSETRESYIRYSTAFMLGFMIMWLDSELSDEEAEKFRKTIDIMQAGIKSLKDLA